MCQNVEAAFLLDPYAETFSESRGRSLVDGSDYFLHYIVSLFNRIGRCTAMISLNADKSIVEDRESEDLFSMKIKRA